MVIVIINLGARAFGLSGDDFSFYDVIFQLEIPKLKNLVKSVDLLIHFTFLVLYIGQYLYLKRYIW